MMLKSASSSSGSALIYSNKNWNYFGKISGGKSSLGFISYLYCIIFSSPSWLVLYLQGSYPTPKYDKRNKSDSISSFFKYFLLGKWAAKAAYIAVPTTRKLSYSSIMNSLRVYIAVFFLPVFGSIMLAVWSSGSPPLAFAGSIGGFVEFSFFAKPKSIK